MTNPWDRPPLTRQGDMTESLTYEGVGRVTSQWETYEGELSHLYAIFSNRYFKPEAYDEYFAVGRTARARVQALEDESERFFTKHPDQKLEGDFQSIIAAAAGYAERRHEIAHGIVRPIHFYNAVLQRPFDPREPFAFCLSPSHHHRNWFDSNGNPKYLYTSVEMNHIAIKMYEQLVDLIRLKHALNALNP